MSCILCRCAGRLAMLLPLCSLGSWRCQSIPSSFRFARILKITKEQPNMLLPFSLRPSMIKMRRRGLPNDPPAIPPDFCFSLLFFTFSRIGKSYDLCMPLPAMFLHVSFLAGPFPGTIWFS